MTEIADFTNQEVTIVRSALDERWNKGEVEIHLVDVDAQLNPDEDEVTQCPALYWQHSDYNFVIMKIADSTYRTHFYYKTTDNYSSAIHEYDDLTECAISFLRLHADYLLKQSLAKEDLKPN